MLKVLKWIIALVGLVGLGAAVFFLIRTAWTMKEIMGAVEATRSRPYDNPMNLIYLTSALAAAGALLLGLGLGLPGRTARGIRKQTLQEAELRRERELHAQPLASVRPEHDAHRESAGDLVREEKPVTEAPKVEPTPVTEPRPVEPTPDVPKADEPKQP